MPLQIWQSMALRMGSMICWSFFLWSGCSSLCFARPGAVNSWENLHLSAFVHFFEPET